MKKRLDEKFAPIMDSVSRYYTEKLLVHGANHKGVDWNSRESQELRFEQLLKVCDWEEHFSINDYGCGYGDLFRFMDERGFDFEYLGFDISEVMVNKAVERFGGFPNCKFVAGGLTDNIADYTVASGIFNVRLNHPDSEWLEYILRSLSNMDRTSAKGFSFNCLTKYSDKEYMRNNLYYADPCWLFDYCKRNFSKNVALLHDYGLYEFTMIVRKEP